MQIKSLLNVYLWYFSFSLFICAFIFYFVDNCQFDKTAVINTDVSLLPTETKFVSHDTFFLWQP